jgi:hypothetical protein
MRPALLIVVLTLGAVTGATAKSTPTAPAPRHTVVCDTIILTAESPPGSYRTVLGRIGAPEAHIPQTVATRSRLWRYWSKAGLLVRGGGRIPVDVIVPKAWRNRVAITWGNSGIVSALRIAPCPAYEANAPWNAYAGGFLLRSRSACVPLLFRIGPRNRTVRFGVGWTC